MDFEFIFDSIYSKEKDNIEDVITALKEAGATQMQSAMILIKKLKISLSESDHLIVNANAWKGNKERVNKFRKDFEDYLDSIT